MLPRARNSTLRLETGTQSHEGFAGTAAVVDYFSALGESVAHEQMESGSHISARRQHVHAAMDLLFDYEKSLASRLIAGLQEIDGVTVQGITAADALHRRVPTVSFTHDKVTPATVAEALAGNNIFVWSGHNYAVEVAKSLGIFENGGAVRVGPVHYNSVAEVDELLGALEPILTS